MRAVVAIIIALLLSARAFGFTDNLSDDWEIRNADKVVAAQNINARWHHKNLAGKVVYSNSFALESVADLTLTLPRSWIPYKVTINGKALKPIKGIGQAYAMPLFNLRAAQLNNGMNKLEIEFDSPLSMLAGFKGGEVFLTENEEVLQSIAISNFFANDYLQTLVYLNAFVGIFCIWVGWISRERRSSYYLFGASLLFSVGHHLLGTGFYRFLQFDPQMVYKIVQGSEALSYFTLTIFLGNFEGKIRWLSSGWFRILVKTYIGAMIGLAFLPFEYFGIATIFSFCFVTLMIPYFMKAYIKRTLFVVFFLAGYLICVTSLASDFLQMNVFYLGFGLFLAQLSGLYFIVEDWVSILRYNENSKIFLSYFFPTRTIFPKVVKLLQSGSGVEETTKAITGDGNVLTVFIDTIGSEARQEEIFCNLDKQSEQLFFSAAEEHFEKYGFEVIKPVGDMLHLALNIHEMAKDSNSERNIITLAVKGLVEFLDVIDNLNATLRTAMLPRINLKIAANFGAASYGLFGSRKALKFDFRGPSIDYTARLESAISTETQKTYGRNILVVSTRLLKMCNDRSLVAKFDLAPIILEAKGKQYEAHVFLQNPDLRVPSLADIGLMNPQGANANPSFEDKPKARIKSVS